MQPPFLSSEFLSITEVKMAQLLSEFFSYWSKKRRKNSSFQENYIIVTLHSIIGNCCNKSDLFQFIFTKESFHCISRRNAAHFENNISPQNALILYLYTQLWSIFRKLSDMIDHYFNGELKRVTSRSKVLRIG